MARILWTFVQHTVIFLILPESNFTAAVFNRAGMPLTEFYSKERMRTRRASLREVAESDDYRVTELSGGIVSLLRALNKRRRAFLLDLGVKYEIGGDAIA